MMLNEDRQLLEKFAATTSEEAFTELVDRHINMVYSIARRAVGDAHLAEDVTQAVFLLMARNAKSIGPRVVIAGWLFKTARQISADARRQRHRRNQREKEAAMLRSAVAPQSTDMDWDRVGPMLDNAVAALRSTDRNVIILRFFEGRSHAEVGAALGISEDAAKMRVSRSLSRLRQKLAPFVAPNAESALGVLLTTHALVAAPVGLSTAASRFGDALPAASTLARHALWTARTINMVSGVGITAMIAMVVAGISIKVQTRSPARPNQSIPAFLGPITAPAGYSSVIFKPQFVPFNSKLAMTVYVPSSQPLSFWHPLLVGRTPAASPLNIPAGSPIIVQPDPGVDKHLLASEINDHHIAGINLGTVAPGDDLAYLASLKGLHILVATGPGFVNAALSNLASTATLEELYLPSTGINDAGLAPLKGLTHLRKIDLSVTAIAGTGFESLRALTNLQMLNLGWTPVTDAGLEQISRIKSLRELHLGFTHVDDAGMDCLTRLTHLEVLQLTGESITNEGLLPLGKLSTLRRLFLGHTKITDAGLETVGKMTSLEELHLGDMPLGDQGLAHLVDLGSLRELDLMNTHITDAGLDSLGKLTALRELNLLDTQVTRDGVDRMRTLLPDCRIESNPRSATVVARRGVSGTLLKIDEDQLIVGIKHGRTQGATTQQTTVNLNDITDLYIDGEPSDVQKLAIGMRINCSKVPATAAEPAGFIVNASSPSIVGTLSKVDGSKLLLTVNSSTDVPREIKVVIDDNTRILIVAQNDRSITGRLLQEGTRELLKPGVRINVVPKSGTATRILLLP